MDTSTLFEDKADLYAASRPLYPKALFDYIASLVKTRDLAWDCATGNGQAAVGLADVFTRVEATDISKGQITNAFQRDNIRYSVQPSETTSFEDNQFDLVNVAQALHWFDYSAFWPEVSRVLKPDGMFVAFSYIWPEVSSTIDRIVRERVIDVTAPYWAPNNTLLWDQYKDVTLPFTPINSPSFELVNHWNANELINYLHTWSGTRKCMENQGTDFFDQASRDIRQAWVDPELKRPVKHPMTLIVGHNW